MAELVINDVDDSMVAQLVKQAEAHCQSLQEELKAILCGAVCGTSNDFDVGSSPTF